MLTFMIRADDRTLKQASKTFNAVGVNVANNPFFCRARRALPAPSERITLRSKWNISDRSALERNLLQEGIASDQGLEMAKLAIIFGAGASYHFLPTYPRVIAPAIS
jgi:hypothetical protein